MDVAQGKMYGDKSGFLHQILRKCLPDLRKGKPYGILHQLVHRLGGNAGRFQSFARRIDARHDTRGVAGLAVICPRRIVYVGMDHIHNPVEYGRFSVKQEGLPRLETGHSVLYAFEKDKFQSSA